MPYAKTTHKPSKKKRNKKKKNNENSLDKTNVKQHVPAGRRDTQNSNHDEYCNYDEFNHGSPNFLPHAGKGCHIIRYPSSCSTVASSTTITTADTTSSSSSSNILPLADKDVLLETVQILGWETDINPQEDFLEGQIIPDVAIDPDENTLTLCNVRSSIRVAYITIYEAQCTGRNGKIFSPGTTTDHQGLSRSCVTFIVLCPPLTFCTLCHIHPLDGGDILDVPIDSDVQEWRRHPDPSLRCHCPLEGFPLLGGPFLCTQGMGGHLTHYFSGNLHAVDFRCDIGTPLLAVEDGVVVQVRQEGGKGAVTGIGATNLFEWNSILIRHERRNGTGGEGVDGEEEVIYTEYVHIQSSKVQEGDVVKRGDEIGYSGSVGFSPEPHLHFAVYKSDEADAVTVGFQFLGQEDGIPYEPRAGMFYSASGPVK